MIMAQWNVAMDMTVDTSPAANGGLGFLELIDAPTGSHWVVAWSWSAECSWYRHGKLYFHNPDCYVMDRSRSHSL